MPEKSLHGYSPDSVAWRKILSWKQVPKVFEKGSRIRITNIQNPLVAKWGVRVGQTGTIVNYWGEDFGRKSFVIAFDDPGVDRGGGGIIAIFEDCMELI